MHIQIPLEIMDREIGKNFERKIMKKYSIPINLVLALIFLYCCNTLYYNSSINAVYTSYNILTLPILIGLTFILHKGLQTYLNLSKRRFVFLLCGFLFGIFFVFGTRLMIDGCIAIGSIFLWLCIPVFTYIMTAFVCLIAQIAPALLRKLLIEPDFPYLDKIVSFLSFPMLWIIIFLCWIPILLACYPGIFSYDAIYQCSQVTDTLQLNAHHPIIHTLMLGGLVQFGRTAFGNANTGMLLYSLLQMLINSCIFAYVLTFLKKHKVSSPIFLLCLCFFALMPFNGMFSICATKDAVFAALFVLFFTFFIELVINSSAFFRTWKNLIGFVLSMFLLLIFRNNMLYAFILCIPFLIILYRKYWRKNVIMLLAPIILLQLYKGILYPLLSVEPGNSREAYSVIIQQYACVYNECELDAAERDMLLAIMDDSSWTQYEPRKTDRIKDYFNTQVFEENIIDYMKLWLKLGIKHPSQYINAFLNLTCSYWYPNDVFPDPTTYRKYIEVYTGADITFESKFPWLLKQLEAIGMESSYQILPGISMLFSPAFYIWIILFLCAYAFYHKRNLLFIIMLPLAALFLTLLFAPLALLRYLYPIILCVPVTCSMIPIMQDS